MRISPERHRRVEQCRPRWRGRGRGWVDTVPDRLSALHESHHVVVAVVARPQPGGLQVDGGVLVSASLVGLLAETVRNGRMIISHTNVALRP